MYNLFCFTNNSIVICKIYVVGADAHIRPRVDVGIDPYEISVKGERNMKATGIVRRVDDLGRIVIPKEIRRTRPIREGDPSYTTLTLIDRFCMAIHSVAERYKAR